MKKKKLLDAVEDGTQSAVEYFSPYVDQAVRSSGQLADQAYTRIQPALKDVGIRGARVAADTFERVHPILDDALDKVSPAVDATVRVVKPAVDDVLTSIPPTVDQARGKVQDDYLPRLAEALRSLAAQPLAHELKVAAASAALAKELEQASKPKKKKSGWKTFGKIVLAGAILAGVAAAVRKLLADPSAGWESHTPSTAYVADPVADVADPVTEEAPEEPEAAADAPEPEATEAPTEEKPAEEKPADPSDIEEKLSKLADEADTGSDGGDASPLAANPYGEGSYMGDEPPEGFTIKGNDRSMKYHVPGSAAYERTIAEVWFNSEEAAEAAGFVKAQR